MLIFGEGYDMSVILDGQFACFIMRYPTRIAWGRPRAKSAERKMTSSLIALSHRREPAAAP